MHLGISMDLLMFQYHMKVLLTREEPFDLVQALNL